MGDVWYLALAYGVIWTGLLVYVFRLTRRAHDLKREVELLRQMLGVEESPLAEAEKAAAQPAHAEG